jgi:hypothetical protein
MYDAPDNDSNTTLEIRYLQTNVKTKQDPYSDSKLAHEEVRFI